MVEKEGTSPLICVWVDSGAFNRWSLERSQGLTLIKQEHLGMASGQGHFQPFQTAISYLFVPPKVVDSFTHVISYDLFEIGL